MKLRFSPSEMVVKANEMFPLRPCHRAAMAGALTMLLTAGCASVNPTADHVEYLDKNGCLLQVEIMRNRKPLGRIIKLSGSRPPSCSTTVEVDPVQSRPTQSWSTVSRDPENPQNPRQNHQAAFALYRMNDAARTILQVEDMSKVKNRIIRWAVPEGGAACNLHTEESCTIGGITYCVPKGDC